MNPAYILNKAHWTPHTLLSFIELYLCNKPSMDKIDAKVQELQRGL